MGLFDTWQSRFGVVLVGIVAFTLFMLANVLGAIFFAVTVAYVSLPVKRWLVRRGVSNGVATAGVTTSAFVAGAAIVAPILAIVYRRRNLLLDYLETLPAEVVLDAAGYTWTVDVQAAIPVVRNVLVDVAIGIASAAPVLLAKVLLFTFVVYALLSRPAAVKNAVLGVTPRSHASDVWAFHERLRDTLYGIYVVQAATAVGTFLVSLVVFYALGYETYFSFAVIAGLLQFLPVVGPSVVVVGISAAEYVSGDADGALLLLVVGLVFVALLPDLIIRPALAGETTRLSPTLYFVGFIAGTLSFGAVGIVAGPVVIAILAEGVAIASRNTATPREDAILGVD